MKTLVNNDELLKLKNDQLTLNALENGGVDNWEWYSRSIENVKPIELTSVNSEIKDYYSSQKLFFQNNPCVFMAYIDEDYCMIKLYAGFDADIEASNFCTQCMVGGDGYLGAHTCEEAQEVIDTVFEIVDESISYIVVPVLIKDLNEQPIIMINHELLSLELLKGRSEYNKKTLQLKSNLIDLQSEIDRLQKHIELKTEELIGFDPKTKEPLKD